jgi:hypothetical protein
MKHSIAYVTDTVESKRFRLGIVRMLIKEEQIGQHALLHFILSSVDCFAVFDVLFTLSQGKIPTPEQLSKLQIIVGGRKGGIGGTYLLCGFQAETKEEETVRLSINQPRDWGCYTGGAFGAGGKSRRVLEHEVFQSLSLDVSFYESRTNLLLLLRVNHIKRIRTELVIRFATMSSIDPPHKNWMRLFLPILLL